MSALGESRTLVAESDPSTVAGKTVDSVESAAAESNDTAASSAKGSDVHESGTTSAPYISSGHADTASVTERDDTGATKSALLHTKETETFGLGATGGTAAVDASLEVVSSDAETEDTGESVASDLSSVATTSADVVPQTATVDSTAGTVPTAWTSSVSSVPLPLLQVCHQVQLHTLLLILTQTQTPKWLNHSLAISSPQTI